MLYLPFTFIIELKPHSRNPFKLNYACVCYITFLGKKNARLEPRSIQRVIRNAEIRQVVLNVDH
jgi:predicted PP-loop superfamily ATPase